MPKPKSQRPDGVPAQTKTTREEWLEAARNVLINKGVSHIKIDLLSKDLGVTRGGFYWFFKNRQDLLDQLLADWRNGTQSQAFEILKDTTIEPKELLETFMLSLMEEVIYIPAWDSAVRDWARSDPKVRQTVEDVDNERIDLLKGAYMRIEENETDALIRARISYYHQIGYYAMEVRESWETRLSYLPTYMKFLI